MNRILIVFLITIAQLSCHKTADSPDEAFAHYKAALDQKDPDVFLDILSKNSLKFFRGRYDVFKASLDKMPLPFRENVGKAINAPADHVKNLTLEQYILFRLTSNASRKANNSQSIDLGNIKTRKISKNNKKAEFMTDHDIKINFVREGRFWKIDLISQ